MHSELWKSGKADPKNILLFYLAVDTQCQTRKLEGDLVQTSTPDSQEILTPRECQYVRGSANASLKSSVLHQKRPCLGTWYGRVHSVIWKEARRK